MLKLKQIIPSISKYFILLLVITGLFSCRPEVEPIFTMDMEVDFEIPAGLGTLLTHTFVIRDVKNPLDAYLQTFGGDTSAIQSIQAGRGELVSIFSTTNYEFVNRVSVWMVSSSDPNIRRELYYLDFNNDNNNDNRLQMLSAISNVKELLLDETFDLEVKLEFRNFSTTLIENRLIFDLVALE